MKLLLIGDLHLRSKAPEGRTDEDFLSTQLNKLQQAYDIALDNDCSAILQTGDFFDRHDPTSITRKRVGGFLWHNCEIPFYCIAGQHDMVGHSQKSIERSEIKCLEEYGLLHVLGYDNYEGIELFGASFGQEIPHNKVKDRFKVLIIHKMIGDRPLYPGQKLDKPTKFLKKHNFDLVCAGDYHYSFVQEVNSRVICNPGALVRLKRNKWDLAHKPQVMIFDTDAREIENHYLDVEPIDKVFIEKDEPIKQDNRYLLDFLDKLNNTGKIATSFDENLQTYYEENEINKDVKDKITKVQESLVEINK